MATDVATGTAEDSILERLTEVGPTWLAGAIAAGPATMAAVITAGASYGYTLLWIVILAAVLGATTQYLAMRLGLLTEQGIASLVGERLGDGWMWLLVGSTVLASGFAQLIIMKTVADVSAIVTGVDARIWGVVWAVVLAAGLAGGGYRLAELGAKVLVSAVVLAFVASLFVVPIDLGAAAGGLVPRIPSGLSGALAAASVLGGGVHITLVTMQSYTMRSRGWTDEDYDLATLDIGTSMLAAFGVYSVAIFLVTASVLFNNPNVDPTSLGAVTAAQALGPIAGTNAKWLFLLGLWGAAVSTLGGNTPVPPYLVADALDWETDVSDSRYRALVVAVALLSAGGAFLGGAFFPLLTLVLAFGAVCTPFAIAVVLYLLNDPETVEEAPSMLANAGGVVLIVFTTAVAANFVRGRLGGGLADPMTAFILLLAVVLSAATLGLGVKHVRRSV